MKFLPRRVEATELKLFFTFIYWWTILSPKYTAVILKATETADLEVFQRFAITISETNESLIFIVLYAICQLGSPSFAKLEREFLRHQTYTFLFIFIVAHARL